MIVSQTQTFDAGEWAPTLHNRSDLAKYPNACRVLENFIGRPQGGVSKRPGREYRGKLVSGATDGKLVEFELKGANSIILAIGGGKMKFFKNGDPIQSGGSDLMLTSPWADGSLSLLRWKQINDVMMFVHPDYPPKILTRTNDTTWDISNFVPGKYSPLLPDNLDETIRITTNFKVDANAVVWSASSIVYEVGDRVTRAGNTYRCESDHVSSNSWRPEDKKLYFDSEEQENRLLWTLEYTDPSSTKNQKVTLTCNKGLWTADHVGAFFEIASKRGVWDYEARLAVAKTATGSNEVYSKVLVCQGKWTFQTFGNWAGKFHVQISRDRGLSWKSARAFQSGQYTPRNATAEGTAEGHALVRIMFSGYSANGTSGSPYAILNVTDGYLRGVVKITGFTNSKSVQAVTVTPIEKTTTAIWAEGAWSDYQGYPRCIDFHQNRVVMAATNRSPHTIWGSEDDNYPNFRRGTLATDPWAHTVMLGQREPIAWLMSDRQLVIGSAVGVFVMFGEDMDKPITAEDRNTSRQSTCGSHVKGPGVIPTDTAALFVQHGGRVVRELEYSFQKDRYEAANLNLFAEHLFRTGDISDFAIQRYPFQLIWFVADGRLYSLCYEGGQNVAGWQRHPTTGEVISVASIRRPAEDENWFIMDYGGQLTVERSHPGAMTDPKDDGYWSDCSMALSAASSLTGNPLAGMQVVAWNHGSVYGPAALTTDFLSQFPQPAIIGLPYAAKIQPMVPEVPLQNGSSRTREIKIHAVAVSLYQSRGGKMGEDPNGTKFDDLRVGSAGLFTGEKEMPFDGSHEKSGSLCIVSSEPFPFYLRAIITKFNVFGDDS